MNWVIGALRRSFAEIIFADAVASIGPQTLGQMLPSRISRSIPPADATLFVGASRGVRRLELKGSMTREFGNARPTWVS